jgi:polysaccharide biosynthesis/export protein
MNWSMRASCYALLVVTVIISQGCSNRSATIETTNTPDGYRIGISDVIEVRVWMEDQLSRTVVVRPDGMISLPLINDVQAEGLMPMALRDVLTEQFSRYISAPEVSVIVDEVRSYRVSVLGEVREPGRYPLDGQLTVLDMIAQAGGLTEFASPFRVTLMRTDANNQKQRRIDNNRVIRRGSHEDILVMPGDVIIVH